MHCQMLLQERPQTQKSIRRHLGGETHAELRHVCPICEKQFARSDIFDRHADVEGTRACGEVIAAPWSSRYSAIVTIVEYREYQGAVYDRESYSDGIKNKDVILSISEELGKAELLYILQSRVVRRMPMLPASP